MLGRLGLPAVKSNEHFLCTSDFDWAGSAVKALAKAAASPIILGHDWDGPQLLAFSAPWLRLESFFRETDDGTMFSQGEDEYDALSTFYDIVQRPLSRTLELGALRCIYDRVRDLHHGSTEAASSTFSIVLLDSAIIGHDYVPLAQYMPELGISPSRALKMLIDRLPDWDVGEHLATFVSLMRLPLSFPGGIADVESFVRRLVQVQIRVEADADEGCEKWLTAGMIFCKKLLQASQAATSQAIASQYVQLANLLLGSRNQPQPQRRHTQPNASPGTHSDSESEEG